MVAGGNVEVKLSHSAVNLKVANKLKICTWVYFAMTYPVMYTFRCLLESKLWNFYLQKATIAPYLKQQQNRMKKTYTKTPTQPKKQQTKKNHKKIVL